MTKVIGFAVIDRDTGNVLGKLYRRRGDAKNARTHFGSYPFDVPYADRAEHQRASAARLYKIVELVEGGEVA